MFIMANLLIVLKVHKILFTLWFVAITGILMKHLVAVKFGVFRNPSVRDCFHGWPLEVDDVKQKIHNMQEVPKPGYRFLARSFPGP
jgi:hypothetical protein